MKLRLFYTLHTLKQNDRSGKKQYTHQRFSEDFPPETDPEKATEECLIRFGRLPKNLGPNDSAPSQYAEVMGTRIVHDHEKPELETFKAYEVGLFDSVEYRKTVSYKPEKK